MVFKVTPTTWTIDESKQSEMVFTITNTMFCFSNIKIIHSNCFRCLWKGKSEDGLNLPMLTVEYLPNRTDSKSNLKLEFWGGPSLLVTIIITKKNIDNNFKAKHQEKNSNFLECKICFLKYDEEERTPRMLTCGHTLCSECAESLWKVQKQEKIICPFDRKVTTLPNSQLGINNLPKNFLALELLQSEKEPKVVKSINSTNTNSEPSDTPCAENPHHEATVFCANCEMDLCEECFARVHLPRVFQSHKKLPLSEKPMQFPKCSIHPYTTAKFNCLESSCTQPSKWFCHNCLIQEHKGHSYEHLMETVSRNLKQLEDSIPKISGMIEELQSVVHWQGEYTASYQPNSPLLMERRNNIVEQFELKKRKALSDFDAGVDIRKKKCQIMKQKLESHTKNVSEIKMEAEKILKSKVNFFRIEDVTKRVEEILDEELKYSDALEEWDSCLNEKMELQWEKKEDPNK